MAPLIEAMDLEGSYKMKPACYSKTLVSEVNPSCNPGSSWSETAQKIMAGDLTDLNVNIKPLDNFHRVYTVTPVHLP